MSFLTYISQEISSEIHNNTTVYFSYSSSYTTYLLLKLTVLPSDAVTALERILYSAPRLAHTLSMTHSARSLHRVPVAAGIKFKTFVLVFQASKGWQCSRLSSHTSSEIHSFSSPQVLNFRACPFCETRSHSFSVLVLT